MLGLFSAINCLVLYFMQQVISWIKMSFVGHGIIQEVYFLQLTWDNTQELGGQRNIPEITYL